tara:strand:+ start:1056 stop:1478 length:423 start_codon:yes stop_codon:yes gene_type:complete
MQNSIDQQEFIRFARNPKNANSLLNRVASAIASGYFDTPDEILEFVGSSKVTGKNEAYLRIAQVTGITPQCPKQLKRAKEIGVSFEFDEHQHRVFHQIWDQKIPERKLKVMKERTNAAAKQSQQNYVLAHCPIEARTFTD